ncbi:MAG: hypothetical protein CSB21_02615 [Deltaproteobacteria bacterium]|nr:MAG: hypothetical protein CSB21_02615 [Deltaproteobacteria bacterium]
MKRKPEKTDLSFLLKGLSSFNIKKNPHKKDLLVENPGWKESEEEYLKAQKKWLEKVGKKKD